MNQWDGTIPQAQTILNKLFPGQTVIIQDSENQLSKNKEYALLIPMCSTELYDKPK